MANCLYSCQAQYERLLKRSAHYKSQLKKNGVRVISATEQISDGPEGIILESMLEGMAEYYSAELAQKINRGLRENALKGKNNGGSIPLGYRLGEDHRLRIDPLTAPVVREIFQRYADGETVREIIEALNERHLLTRKGQEFRRNSFSILQAELEHPQYSWEDIIEWISRFRYGDPNDKAYRRQIIDIFLNSIYVFDDKLVFTYNYKNGSQTVGLSDVFAAFGSDSRSRTPPTSQVSSVLRLELGFFVFGLP